MTEDFDILYEHVERGYAQGIRQFVCLMRIFEAIRDMGTNNMKAQAEEMGNRVTSSQSYNEALSIMQEYVDVY
jgi:hypothetical protein